MYKFFILPAMPDLTVLVIFSYLKLKPGFSKLRSNRVKLVQNSDTRISNELFSMILPDMGAEKHVFYEYCNNHDQTLMMFM